MMTYTWRLDAITGPMTVTLSIAWEIMKLCALIELRSRTRGAEKFPGSI